MRSSGVVITLLLAGLILASGCAGYGPAKTTDSKMTGQTGFTVSSSEGNTSSSLVRPWYVKALIINGTPQVPVRLTGIQLTFYANGSFSGFDSCNPYTGLWQADEKRIAISNLESLKKYCNEPPGVMEQESEYFALLTNARFYRVNGEDMVLSDSIGEDSLVFKQVFF
jgi:heat shock protein HslJ